MHPFSDIIENSTNLALSALRELEENTTSELQTSGSTRLVKMLQAISMHKTITAIGMFSLFESTLQLVLNCKNGFEEAKDILTETGDVDILNRFNDFILAINVLKHGNGRSYDLLKEKNWGSLFQFIVSNVDDNSQSENYEGDLSDIISLINVSDEFVSNCMEVILQVCKVINSVRPNCYL